ncbi:sel1 repeat family protein [Rhodanobacter denitrificans]|uniref:sel1 repeat family protein n=1 Tax=Rhodanobacter denitrificans TaxID=666685 RepID=UPI0011C035E6|nr:sel1 repeat family protein [Rhodanobacter denitrificans]
MNLFQGSWFKSTNDSIESRYQQGVSYLKANYHSGADRCLREAAAGGHASALYNLAILHGCGVLSPYDLDFAATCYYKAAKLGHPSAAKSVFMLEAADRGGFGSDNLAQLAAKTPPDRWFSSILMICATRYFSAVSKLHGATDLVIASELHGASISECPGILSFIERTGVPTSLYSDHRTYLEPGSAADQITDGLNSFSAALRAAGNERMLWIAARCTIVGYMISKTSLGDSSKPLLGLVDFYNQ